MRRFVLLLILLALPLSALAESEVYIAARTDGKQGTGTAADPFDGSTQQKFDGVLAALGPATTIHIGAGRFHTKGEASFKVQPDTKIRGAGMEVTKMIQDGTGKPHACVFYGTGGGIEIEDLSIDCGYENQRKVQGEVKCNAAAINLYGITMSGCQGAIVQNNVFEHFMGCCVYQNTWPMRDIIICSNIMTDIDQGVFLAGDHLDMVNFQIRNNVFLLHDGLDLKNIVNGVAHSVIPHSEVVVGK